MKKHFLVFMMMILPACVLMAQIMPTDPKDIKGVKIVLDGPPRPLNDPLYVVFGDHQILEYVSEKNENPKFPFDVLKPEWIDSVSVLKGEKAVDKYGERGRFGVVLISLHQGNLAKLPEEWQKRFTESKP